MNPIIDIESLGFDQGAHLLVKKALRSVPVGGFIRVSGRAPEWNGQIEAWCRSQGHPVRFNGGVAEITRGSAEVNRWTGAMTAGTVEGVSDEAPPEWGLAARGAKVESGCPSFPFRLRQKKDVWSGTIKELLAQAQGNQWNPDMAVDWTPPKKHSDGLEEAIVQIMTYLIENENAALVIPARFLGQVHPHFREIQALLALQVVDESRHIEVFTRRLNLYGQRPALSTAGGQASLKTLVDEPDFSVAGFLLSVLGEGTFVDLLQFLERHAPDPVTRQICLLSARDEIRHVAFGMGHLLYHLELEPGLRARLRQAVVQRHESLVQTSGLNEEVFDSLLHVAAGALTPSALAEGFKRLQALMTSMAEGRRLRLVRLGFEAKEARELSSLHTRNFM